MIKFTLNSNIPSKKNSKQIVSAGGRYVLLPSNKHKDWHTEQMWKLKMLKIPVQTEPVCIEMTFYAETKAKGDLDNKATSVLDLMKDVGIIEDDNWYVVPSLILKFGGQDKLSPRCEVLVYPV